MDTANGTLSPIKATWIGRSKLEEKDMPTVLVTGPHRFFFYAGDRDEPVHVHVERDQKLAKFWLGPVRLARNDSFRPAELREVERLVMDHLDDLRRAWHDYFDR